MSDEKMIELQTLLLQQRSANKVYARDGADPVKRAAAVSENRFIDQCIAVIVKPEARRCAFKFFVLAGFGCCRTTATEPPNTNRLTRSRFT